MSRLPVLLLAFLLFRQGKSSAESLALVRDSTVVTAQTLQDDVPVKLTPVSPGREVTAILLIDTFQSDDMLRVRHAIQAAFPGAHALNVSNSGGDAGTLLTALGVVASSLPSNWAPAVIIGRLPTPTSDEAWLTSWLTDAFTRQRARVSFWSLDGSAPAWAQNLTAATAGTVATSGLNALRPMSNDHSSVLFEASWANTLKSGAWPYTAELKTGAGERLPPIQMMMLAPGFAPPLGPYLAARANLRASGANDEEAMRKVLEWNPADVDALRQLAKICAQRNGAKESAVLWRRLAEITPRDGAAWAELGFASYSAESYDSAGQALLRAGMLGVKNRATLETQARLHIRRNDFANALALLDEALVDDKNAQSLWLLRADCALRLNRWPAQAGSLERALALGPAPIERNTELIAAYLAAGQPERALPHLRVATGRLPPEAAIRAQYAAFWEQSHDPAAAETLWKSALESDAKFEPAYAGLGQHYLDARRPADAMRIADKGLEAAPGSLRLILIKESALENLGDLYGARRLLNDRAKAAKQIELLRRRARLEDYYGSDGAAAYLGLLHAQIETGAPQIEVVETCRRGLIVALRTESLDAAKTFAGKLAAAGDPSGLSLLEQKRSAAGNRADILGGSDALHFLVLGSAKSRPDRILIDYCRALNAATSDLAPTAVKAKWQRTGAAIHEYFARVSALAALGARKQDRVEILLSLRNKADRQRTEKALGILGLKMKNGKAGLTVESAEGKSQIKKQDTLAALAIDDQGIQEALAAGKSYTLKIEVDSVPVFPAPDLWQKAFYESGRYPGGFVEALVTDTRLPQLYVALNSMDRAAAEALLTAVPLRALAERFTAPLSMFSAALAMNGSQAEVPGGNNAYTVWQQLAGVSPAEAVPFFEALLKKDDGRLIAFFYTLSELDPAHQLFFTRSPARAKRFYDLFRESAEMRHGGERRLSSSSFAEFLREVPLNEDGSVDFPGAPEVWMVAKGHNAAGSSVAKMTRKIKRAAAPDDEDEILIRLANTEYKAQHREQSELANFVAVSRIDAERDEPMDPDSALLLAQGYASFGGLYPYFTALGDFEAADYQKAFAVATKIAGADVVTANSYLGEWHSFLAMLALLHESGLAPPRDVIQLYRTAAERFATAKDDADWNIASLSALDDLARRAAPDTPSHDAAIRALLVGAGASEKDYRQLLALQKVPSLDALFSIWTSVAKAANRPAAVEEAQRALSTLAVLTPPKAWKLYGESKKSLDRYQTAEAQAILLKLRETLAKRKRNQNEIAKLSAQLMAAFNPWTELAMAGTIYARYLDPTDLIVSEDPMLLRKHQFVSLMARNGKPLWFTPANLAISSEGQGSYFTGGLAEFSLAAGQARAAGNHLGGSGGEAFAAAVFASVRATDWRGVTTAGLQSFGASVRLAREWIVESAASPAMHRELEQDSRGLLSLTRRKMLLEGIDRRDWSAVWQSVSVGDLHFFGDAVVQRAPKDLWTSPALQAMKQAAVHARELDALGSVAPSLSGCAQTRLRRYEPYEEYERYAFPNRLAERLAELKLYLAWLADASAWPPGAVAALSAPVANTLLSNVAMRDMWDWDGALDSFRSLNAEKLEPLLNLQ